MESNHCLLFFHFGLSMLPKIYSDTFPSLVLLTRTVFQFKYYDTAYKIEYTGDENNLVEFNTSSNIYNACPREDETLHWTNALEIKSEMTDLLPTTLERFVTGLFGKYDCETKIKPIALKYQDMYKNKFEPLGFQRYDIGFLVYDESYSEIEWTRYENASNEQLPKGYRLVKFLTVILDKQLGTIYSVSHEILSGQFLQPYLVFDPLPPNEKNFEEYGFDVDSLYTEENQLNILSPIFGQFNPEHSLIKVQLAPYKDFLLDTWKLTSFMDLNTVPMWKQVHHQWIKIEEFVRKVARELGDVPAYLSVETGTAQILELLDVNHQLQPVYLGKDKKFAVPKYTWKRIAFLETRAILIVMHNDPYTANQERLCNMGKDYGWLVSNNDFETGLMYVCPVDEDIKSKLDHKLEVSDLIFKLKDT